MPLKTAAGPQADVVVIGAGLSGLMAARLLEEAGAKVVVLEGAAYVGGRAHTLDELPGRPDAGGIQVGANYHRLNALAERLGVAMHPGGEFDLTALYHVRGQTVPQADWAASPANRLEAAEREVPPALLPMWFARRLPQLSGVGAWMADEGRRIDVPYGAALREAGASAEAIRLIAANIDRSGLDNLSALGPARSAAFFAAAGPNPGLRVLAGGSQRLPEAMAAALQSAPRLGQIVRAVAETANGVRVDVADGAAVTARHAIITIPFSALRHVGLEGPSAEAMRPLIDTLPYTRASFAYLSAHDPFWNSDGLPRTLWSDDPLLGRVFVLGDDPAMLKVWLSGPDADAIDRLDPADAGSAIIARLEAARPSAKGKLKLEAMFSWQKNPLARGIFHQMAPGGSALLAHAAGATARGKRLHFAGDHLSQSASGLEGALESGECAARTVLLEL